MLHFLEIMKIAQTQTWLVNCKLGYWCCNNRRGKFSSTTSHLNHFSFN